MLERRDETAQTMAEYAITLSVISIVIMLALANLSQAVGDRINAVVALF